VVKLVLRTHCTEKDQLSKYSQHVAECWLVFWPEGHRLVAKEVLINVWKAGVISFREPLKTAKKIAMIGRNLRVDLNYFEFLQLWRFLAPSLPMIAVFLADFPAVRTR
jgi:hypothetical protein